MLRFPARLAAALPRASSSKVGKHTRLPSGTTSLRNPKRSSPVTANVASAGATPTSVATSTAGSRASASAASAASTTSYPTRSREGGAGLSAPSKEKNNAGRLHFDASKAGLQLVDKAHVERVIQEASKDTPFYLKEQRREEARREKADAVLKKAAQYDKLTPAQKQAIKVKVDYLESELEEERDLHRRFIHVDMDMFYAAVEEKKNPALRDVPFGVGSYNMLSTTNYIARQYGVRSGMPGFIGRKLCPDLLIVPTDFASYRREAGVVHSIAARYDPQFVSHGLDELTMELTGYVARSLHERGELMEDKSADGGVVGAYDVAERVVQECRSLIAAETGLTASAGLAPTPTLAKIASNMKKPNGQHSLRLRNQTDVHRFHATLPVRRVPGIGQYMEFILTGLGIGTVGQIYEERHRLSYIFTDKTFRFLLATALGVCGGGMYDDRDSLSTFSPTTSTAFNSKKKHKKEGSENDAANAQKAKCAAALLTKVSRGSSMEGSEPMNHISSSRSVSSSQEDECKEAVGSDWQCCTTYMRAVLQDNSKPQQPHGTTRTEDGWVREEEGGAAEHNDSGGESSETSESEDDATWRKSIGQERTFSQLTSSAALSSIALRCLCVSHERLVRHKFVCRRVVLKVKHRDFRVHQYSKRLLEATDDFAVLRNIVEELLLPLLAHYVMYRLFGVRLEQLASSDGKEDVIACSKSNDGGEGTVSDCAARNEPRPLSMKIPISTSHFTLDEMFDKALARRTRHGNPHSACFAGHRNKSVTIIDIVQSDDEEDITTVAASHVPAEVSACAAEVVSISPEESYAGSQLDVHVQQQQ